MWPLLWSKTEPNHISQAPRSFLLAVLHLPLFKSTHTPRNLKKKKKRSSYSKENWSHCSLRWMYLLQLFKSLSSLGFSMEAASIQSLSITTTAISSRLFCTFPLLHKQHYLSFSSGSEDNNKLSEPTVYCSWTANYRPEIGDHMWNTTMSHRYEYQQVWNRKLTVTTDLWCLADIFNTFTVG